MDVRIALKAVLERCSPLAGRLAANEAFHLVMNYLTTPACGPVPAQPEFSADSTAWSRDKARGSW